MILRRNNLNSLREVHERMRLYTVSWGDSRWIRWDDGRDLAEMGRSSAAPVHERLAWLNGGAESQVKTAGKMPALPLRATSRLWRGPTSLFLCGCRGSGRCDMRCE